MPPTPPPAPEPARPSAPPARAAALPEGGPNKPRLPGKLLKLRKQLRPRLLKTLDEADQWQRGDADKEGLLVGRLKQMLDTLTQQSPEYRLSPQEFNDLRDALLNDLLGFGAIEPLVRDRTVSEIMVNGPDVIFKEQKGKLTESEITFDDEDHVLIVDIGPADRVDPRFTSLGKAFELMERGPIVI